MPVVTIENTMIKLECQTDVRGGNTCPAGQSHAAWWKLSNKCRTTDGRVGPQYRLKNVILYAEHASRNGVKGMIPLPPAEQLLSVENVTVLYTGPGKLPTPSAAVTIVTDKAEAARIWNEGEAKWLVDRGCAVAGQDCAFLRSTGWPPAPPPEPPEITAIYNSVSGLRSASGAVQEALRTGNLRRVGANTGAKHSLNLHNAIHALIDRLGDHPAFARMHTLASHSMERAVALSAAVAANDGQAALVAAQPGLTDEIVLQVQVVREALDTF